jgi:glycosyltransferase involved in cell wall biosynthesis
LTRASTPAVLYISYDGMLEPLGQSQVLAYLEKLAGSYEIHLISFEKKSDRRDAAKTAAMTARLEAAGVAWTPLAYHKTPSAPATAYDIAVGTLTALYLVFRHRVRIVHVRSYVPALMALPVTRLSSAKLLFDMRGFWADERVDGNLWPAGGRLYRIAKALEARFLEAADHVVTLTHASAREIARFPYLSDRAPPLSVIPTCADLDRFSPRPVDPDRPFTFGYVGSVGTWYLFDEALACFKLILERRPDARLLIVNRNEHGFIRAAVEQAGIDPARLEIAAAEHRDVPAMIAKMTVGSAIIMPAYSKMASAPTKLAEYLGCGVPCIGNVNVGDMEEILEGNRVGVALTGFSEAERRAAVDRLLALLDEPELQTRCAMIARRLFSLDAGVDAYRGIYESLAETATEDIRRTGG